LNDLLLVMTCSLHQNDLFVFVDRQIDPKLREIFLLFLANDCQTFERYKKAGEALLTIKDVFNCITLLRFRQRHSA